MGYLWKRVKWTREFEKRKFVGKCLFYIFLTFILVHAIMTDTVKSGATTVLLLVALEVYLRPWKLFELPPENRGPEAPMRMHRFQLALKRSIRNYAELNEQAHDTLIRLTDFHCLMILIVGTWFLSSGEFRLALFALLGYLGFTLVTKWSVILHLAFRDRKNVQLEEASPLIVARSISTTSSPNTAPEH